MFVLTYILIYIYLIYLFTGQVLANMVAMGSEKFAADRLPGGKPVGKFDMANVNTRGGSLALGHPFGATGEWWIMKEKNENDVMMMIWAYHSLDIAFLLYFAACWIRSYFLFFYIYCVYMITFYFSSFCNTGARLVTTAANRLQSENKRFALLTACADGGLAHACILERYDNK